MIEARSLTRRFGSFTAVDDVSFTVPDGALLALLGPNGAGKTTTVRMLGGLIAPSVGDATVSGFDVRANPSAVRARAGLVTDAPGLYEQMSLPAYLDFFGALYGMPQPRRRQRIDELIEFFELSDHRRERMSGFSKGMKQKVALARALLHEPTALFLDEPTSGLDPLAARAVRDLITNLKHSSRSVILCTHDLDEAERLADTVAIMSKGRIVALGAPAALRARTSPEATVRITLAEPFAQGQAMLTEVAGTLPAEGAQAADTLMYRTARPQEVNPQVVERLVTAGARIVTVSSETRSLEDVYAAAVGSPQETGLTSSGAESLNGAVAASQGSEAQ
ncbi:MAG TPA: ABC transporter ATP-binding protein [Ktedonobacterales bacterium]|nr:ABC transporter ATP-binding protein [Ktedonobacterales bacterium]